jgi:multidrug transporter EmrE-like cation transporter
MLHYIALIIGIVFNAVANIMIKSAMRNVEMGNGLVQTALSMAFQPMLILGIGCFVIALGGYSFALTRIDLSVGYPVMTSLGLIIVAGYASFSFREPMTLAKLGGYVLVLAGVVLVFMQQKTPEARAEKPALPGQAKAKAKTAPEATSDRPNAKSPLGMNLRFVSFSNSSPPFANALKMGMPWISRTIDAWDDGRKLTRSKEGWVTALEPKQIAATLVPSGIGGRMVLLWEGRGRLSVQNAKRVIEENGNRILFEADPRVELLVHVQEIDGKNPPKNIALVPAELEKDHEKQLFHPLFLERLAPFKVIRFLEWSHVNGSKLERWEDRTLPENAFQSTDRGVAYEYQIELVNRLGADLWLCVPHQANDEFVRKLGKLVKEKLHPHGKVWVEWSNEVWNDSPAFTQAAYARTKGMQAKLHRSDDNAARLRFQSRRSVQVFQLFEEGFGDQRRMIRVMASQTGNTWAHKELLDFEDAHRSVDVLAIAPYFGNEIGDARREKWLASLAR